MKIYIVYQTFNKQIYENIYTKNYLYEKTADAFIDIIKKIIF